jgi:UDP-GlcNAc:undecaprenyl-phosphate GlcNAc-1-phosphate transferase
MSEEIRLAIAFALALVLSGVATPIARRVAVATSFYDQPKGYKEHHRPTPYLGGSAVVLATVASTLVATRGGDSSLSPVFGCALVLLAVGTLDDRVRLGILTRFMVQIGAGFVLWASGVGWDIFSSDLANLWITLLWVVGLVNAFNLLDNLDGSAATVGGVAAAGAGLLAFGQGNHTAAYLALGLSGACAGFLPYNLAKPSRIFLGDGGSMPIGLIMAAAVMAIPYPDGGIATLVAAAPLVGIAIFDTSLVVVSRGRRGAPVLSGARDHLTHRLLKRLGTTRRLALVLAATQATLCGLAAILYQLPADAVIVGGVAYVALGVAVLVRLESRRFGPEPARGWP